MSYGCSVYLRPVHTSTNVIDNPGNGRIRSGQKGYVAAAALFLVGIAPGGHIHIQQIFSGSLPWTNRVDIISGLVVFLIVGFFFYIFRRPLTDISNNYRQIHVEKAKAVFWDFIFYLLLGIVITLSVQMGGIVVVFAYLIIPATISAVLSSRLVLQLIIIWASTTIASISGLLFAYYLDFSIGPSIASFLGFELIIIAIFARLTTMSQNRYL